jgi:outer membrane receptor protein involved in Fe transport
MFDKRYLADIVTSVGGAATYQPGAPRAYVASLQYEF